MLCNVYSAESGYSIIIIIVSRHDGSSSMEPTQLYYCDYNSSNVRCIIEYILR